MMSETVFMVMLHVIAATPPTVAAAAALITSLKTSKQTNQIHILVNGERARLQREVDQLRRQLAQKGIADGC